MNGLIYPENFPVRASYPWDGCRKSASILGESTGRQSNLTELLARETEGNVFFVVEVLRALAEEAGQLDLIGVTTLPTRVFSSGMKTIVQRRLNRLPDWVRPLLQAAAIAG